MSILFGDFLSVTLCFFYPL